MALCARQQARQVPISLLITKLYIPPARSELVPRPRLVERLNAGLERRLTFISAPAGYGKTTLVAEWVRGQQQRVGIARALANRPRLILADEPTGELDSTTAREILGLFRRVVEEERVTVVMVSHDGLVDEYVDEVLELRDGRTA